MATWLLLFIKFGSSVDHGESISVDKFLFGVHIIWIFLLSVHIPPWNSLLSWLLTLHYSQAPFAFLTTSIRFLHLTPSYFCSLNMSSPKLWRGAEFVIPKYVSLAKNYSKLVIFKKTQTLEKLWKPSRSYPLWRTLTFISEISIYKGISERGRWLSL